MLFQSYVICRLPSNLITYQVIFFYAYVYHTYNDMYFLIKKINLKCHFLFYI
ncbi:hypothetical protein HanRHA438_Chr06g0283741 [Helianthus annuus]|nr:hypothetical protein HanRHA438_Chr06g0283741 [Helianthus annuus]